MRRGSAPHAVLSLVAEGSLDSWQLTRLVLGPGTLRSKARLTETLLQLREAGFVRTRVVEITDLGRRALEDAEVAAARKRAGR